MRRLILMAVLSGSLLLGAAPVAADTTPGDDPNYSPIAVELTIDPVGSINPRTGTGTIRGTVTCDRAATASVYGEVTQAVGRIFTIRGGFGTDLACSPTTTAFVATLTSYEGRFAPGNAALYASAYASDALGDGWDDASGLVRLRR